MERLERQRLVLVAQKAEKFIQDQGIDRLPVNPIEIAESLDILVRPKPDTAGGVSGMLLWHNNAFGIMYATHIDNEGFQRFSIAHELGHFLLEGHIDNIFPEGGGVHESYAGFTSSNPYELEADHFAAGLLMPDPMFTRALDRCRDGLEGIKELSALCCTSLTATAIRYAGKCSAPVAVIMSTGQSIDCCFMSRALQDFDSLTWLRKGERLPVCETSRFNRDADNITGTFETRSGVDLREWFGGYRSIEGTEEVIGLGGYGKTLTVISSSVYADDEDEDEDIEESWTPRFH